MLDVDLSRNMIGYRGETVRVTNQIAELAYILAQKSKRHEISKHDHIRAKLWGVTGGPNDERNAVKVLVHRLRKICSRWDFKIEVYRNQGYELIPPESTPRSQVQ